MLSIYELPLKFHAICAEKWEEILFPYLRNTTPKLVTSVDLLTHHNVPSCLLLHHLNVQRRAELVTSKKANEIPSKFASSLSSEGNRYSRRNFPKGNISVSVPSIFTKKRSYEGKYLNPLQNSLHT